MYLINIDNTNKQDIVNFLESIRTIKNIDYDILSNGVALANNEDNICGYITYEEFCDYGLIRYFIFSKLIEIKLINEMFAELVNKASKNKVKSLISIGNTNEVVELFMKLNFYELDFDNFIINDKRLYGTEFEKSTILKYEI